MFKGRTFHVSVRIPRRNVVVVQSPRSIDQIGRRRRGKLAQEPRNDVTPSFLALRQVERLNRLLTGLVRRKTRPVVSAVALRGKGLFKIVFRLQEPISPSLSHARLQWGRSGGNRGIVDRPTQSLHCNVGRPEGATFLSPTGTGGFLAACSSVVTENSVAGRCRGGKCTVGTPSPLPP